ncbi:MAG: UDP-2,3-diacylglucosamine diphosphatase [Calditrichaeota bacterium]|nr:MAG: UDP-2,3-diacylglucosamine diphosphatase [Calditrichota bacterium]
MPNSAIFLSDAHIGANSLSDDKARERKLIQFLEHFAELNTDIYIVGDLYEFWFEYKEVIPNKNIPLLACLYRLAEGNAQVHYIRGNHDLWIGSFFSDELGIAVHKTAIAVKSGNKNIYVTHGDGLAAQDSGYRLLKRIFTNKLNIKLFRWIHPDLGIPLAKKFSQVSRDKGEPDFAWETQYREFAISKLLENFDGFIMGHTHWPLHEILSQKHYINLGDWINHFTYCEAIDGNLTLKQWPSKKVYQEAKIRTDFDHHFK